MHVARGGERRRATALCGLVFAGGCFGLGRSAPGEYRQWMGGPPLLGDFNKDGVEDVAGWFSDEGIVAFNGATFEPLWSRLDRRIDFRGGNRLAVIAGEAMVVAQPRAVEILDLTTGATRTALTLTDEVGRLCAGDGKVGVYQIDEVKFTLDVATGKRDDAAAPPKCPDMEDRPGLCDLVSHARCEGSRETTKVKLTDPDTGDMVGVEIKEPGTPEVTIVGHDRAGQPTYRLPFDPSGMRIEALDLVGGTLLIRQSYVNALDARTGATLWTSSCGGSSGDTMIGTPTRVYYECDSLKTSLALRIVDRATGAVLKDLGKPRHP